MKNKFYNKGNVLVAGLFLMGSVFALASCEGLFNTDDSLPCGSAEMKLPEIPEGTLFTKPIDPNITNPIIEEIIELSPGQTSSANYKGVGAGGLERDLSQMKVRWTFEHDNILVNPETGKYYQKEEVEQMPSFKFIFTKQFSNDLPDDQIQKGDIITSFQAVITNKCGETNPITAQVKIKNSGNVVQQLNQLSTIARTEHIQAFHNNKLYLLFGRGARDNYVYDIPTRKLTLLPPINFDMYGLDANTRTALERSLYSDNVHGPFTTYAQDGSKVYLAIPLSDGNISQGDVLWVYDLETLQLSKLPSVNRTVYNGSGPANPAIRGFATVAKMTLLDKKIYYFPLFKNLGEAYVGVFDVTSNQWSEEDIHVPIDELVPAIIYQGNPNFAARIYFQLFYALDNQLKFVFEENREVTYDLDAKTLTVKNSDYKHFDMEARPTSGFVYDEDYYFLSNEVLGGVVQRNSFILYKKNNDGSVAIANFFGGGRRHQGRQFTLVANTMFVVGGDAVRYWIEE